MLKETWIVAGVLAASLVAAADMNDPAQREAWLATLDSTVGGNWKRIGEAGTDRIIGENGVETVVFVTHDRRVVNGRISTVWVRVEVSPGPKTVARSVRMRQDFDCTEFRVRIVQVDEFKGSNFEGGIKSTASDPFPDWNNIPPGTVGEALLEFACDGVTP